MTHFFIIRNLDDKENLLKIKVNALLDSTKQDSLF